MTMRILVVGAGASGTAAAWAAASAGASVTVVQDGAGASELMSGAVDAGAVGSADSGPVESDLAAFSAALGLWRLDEACVRVATLAGIVRSARGCDLSVLDLSPLAGRRIAVADLGQGEFDANLLARALAESAFARTTGTRFEPVRVDLAATSPQTAPADGARAAVSDAEPFRERLVAALGRASTEHDAWLYPPCLGLAPATPSVMRCMLGRPIGEVTSRPGGLAGARFVRARDAMLTELNVKRIMGRVRAVRAAERGHHVELAPDADGSGPDLLTADAVVLAIGGLVAGGLELAPPDVARKGAFRLGLGVDAIILLNGRPVGGVASLHGVDFSAMGREALDRVGIAVGDDGRVMASGATSSPDSPRGVPDPVPLPGPRGLWAAGACIADRPRTLLEAVRSGLRAGRAAAGG
ncbi:MAG: hypothetical protein JW751_09945 [Polyangiaceae bacterium]|nr:hypothetical protein [Polyangiaceae bacterium]